MPTQIDCPECKGRGWWYPPNEIGGSTRVTCRNCKNGKITVYTATEIQEERETIIKMIDNYIDDDNYSLSQLYEAIRGKNA